MPSGSLLKRRKAAGGVSAPSPSPEGGVSLDYSPSAPPAAASPSSAEADESDQMPDRSPSSEESFGDGESLRSDSSRSREEPNKEGIGIEVYDDEPLETVSVASEITLVALSPLPAPGPSSPQLGRRRLRRGPRRSRYFIAHNPEEDDWIHGPTSRTMPLYAKHPCTPLLPAPVSCAGDEIDIDNVGIAHPAEPLANVAQAVVRSGVTGGSPGSPAPAALGAENRAASSGHTERELRVGKLFPFSWED